MDIVLNTLLEQKILQAGIFDDKDIYEIRQIFSIVTDEKKKQILDNFENIVISITQIKSQLRETQEILLGQAISNIENAIIKQKESKVLEHTKTTMSRFKQMM